MADTKIKVSDDPEDILQEISANLPKKRLNVKGDVGIPYEAYRTPGEAGIKSVVPISGGEIRGSYENKKGEPTVKIGATKSFGDLNVSADAIRQGVRNSLKARADMPVGEGRGYLEGQYNPDVTSYRAGVGMPLYGGDFSAGAQRIVPRQGMPMNQFDLMYQRKFASGGSVPRMSGIARNLAAQGRNGDDILVHMSRKELRGIASLASDGLTINPHTGLPEAFNLLKSKYLPTIAAIASQFIVPGNPWAAALAAGGTKVAQGGSLQEGLMQGAIAGASAGISGSLEAAGANTSAAATTEAANVAAQKAATDFAAPEIVNSGFQNSGQLVDQAGALRETLSLPASAVPAASSAASAASNALPPGSFIDEATGRLIDPATAKAVASANPSLYPQGEVPFANEATRFAPSDGGTIPTYQPQSIGSSPFSAPPRVVGYNPSADALVDQAQRQAMDEAASQTAMIRNPSVLGSERLGNIVSGASNLDSLKNAVLSKNGLMLGLGAIGASGLLEPKGESGPPSNIMSSSYRPISAYDRKVSFAPAGYDRRLGEFNYFPGDRYARYAMGGQVNQPAVPLDLSQNYPGSNIMKSSYASIPSTESQEVVDGYGPKINPFTGAEKMAAGGIATFDQGGDISRIREIRRSYSSRAQAEKDAMRGGDVAKRLGLASADDPALNYAFGPRQHLDGKGDGMSDSIPATIEGRQPALLSKDEFVVPADVVSHLGNGSSEAGADKLYKMLDKVRMARTGTKKQGKQILPEKYLPA